MRNHFQNQILYATIRSPLTPKNTKIALPYLKNSGALKN